MLALLGNQSKAVTTPAAVHPEVLLIVGAGPDRDYNSRMRAVQRLPLDLSRSDIDRLVEFLRIQAHDDPLQSGHLNSVKNDVVVMLQRQNRPYAGFSAHLIEGFRNEEMDVVWRDYCLQHLPGWHQISRDPEERGGIVDLLWEATLLKESTFAGTALLTLRQMANDSAAGIEQQKLADRALSVASDTGMSNPSRISAIQVASAHPNILPLARKLAQDASANMLLRMSAVGVLGTSAAAEDLKILESFSNSSDVRLRGSARASLRNRTESARK